MDLQIQILRRSSNHRQRCYQINDKKCTIIFTIKRVHIFQTPQNQCHQPTHIIHYRASYRLYIIVYITSDLIYSRTKIVIVLASEMLCFLPKTTRLVYTMSQLKPKLMHSDFICSRFYVRYSDCFPGPHQARFSAVRILSYKCPHLRKGESIIFVTCVTMTSYRVTCDES